MLGVSVAASHPGPASGGEVCCSRLDGCSEGPYWTEFRFARSAEGAAESVMPMRRRSWTGGLCKENRPGEQEDHSSGDLQKSQAWVIAKQK